MVYGSKRFALISIHNGINPTNIICVSKRLIEMIIRNFDAKIKGRKAYDIVQLFIYGM